MPSWLLSSLVSLLFFGLWGFFSKLALFHVNSKVTLIMQTLGVVIISLFLLKNIEIRDFFPAKGAYFGILTGAAYGLGCLFYLIAVDKGKLTTVVTLTALYPLVTILCSFIWLNEVITTKQWAGIALALLSIVIMSI